MRRSHDVVAGRLPSGGRSERQFARRYGDRAVRSQVVEVRVLGPVEVLDGEAVIALPPQASGDIPRDSRSDVRSTPACFESSVRGTCVLAMWRALSKLRAVHCHPQVLRFFRVIGGLRGVAGTAPGTLGLA